MNNICYTCDGTGCLIEFRTVWRGVKEMGKTADVTNCVDCGGYGYHTEK